VFARPGHPYTVGCSARWPRLDRRSGRLATVEGRVPDMTTLPAGCRFAPRCPFAREICVSAPPPLVSIGERHWTRCARAPIEALI